MSAATDAIGWCVFAGSRYGSTALRREGHTAPPQRTTGTLQPFSDGIGQGSEALEAERFAADIGRQTACGQHVGQLRLRQLRKAGGQPVDERLAALGKAGAHRAEEQHLVADVRGRGPRAQADDGARHLRLRMKHEAGTSNSSSGAAWYWQRMENAE